MFAPSLIVISCGAQKLEHAAPAARLYTGGYFAAMLRYARHHAPDEQIRILSSKHGLLRLDQTVAPYEMLMRDRGAVTLYTVQQQACEQRLLGADPVWLVAGRAYTSTLLRVWPRAVCILDGRGGMGSQIGWMKRQLREAAHA